MADLWEDLINGASRRDWTSDASYVELDAVDRDVKRVRAELSATVERHTEEQRRLRVMVIALTDVQLASGALDSAALKARYQAALVTLVAGATSRLADPRLLGAPTSARAPEHGVAPQRGSRHCGGRSVRIVARPPVALQ